MAKANTELSRQVEAAALAQLQSQAPEGAQAGLADFGKKLGKVVKEVAPGVIKGVFAAGLDGSFTPAEIAGIVADAVRKIMESRPAGDAAPAA